MNLELNIGNLLVIALALLGAFWTLAKVIANQQERYLDARFKAQEVSLGVNHAQLSKRLDNIETLNREETSQWRRIEHDLLRMQAELPLHYVRREDYIRGQSVLEAKIDGLGGKIENAQLRALKNV
ncbi:MAG: hypothetical protein ABI606_12205 [Rhodoferax sp.]